MLSFTRSSCRRRCMLAALYAANEILATSLATSRPRLARSVLVHRVAANVPAPRTNPLPPFSAWTGAFATIRKRTDRTCWLCFCRRAWHCSAAAQPSDRQPATQSAPPRGQTLVAAAATVEAPPLSREKEELSQLMNKEYKCVAQSPLSPEPLGRLPRSAEGF